MDILIIINANINIYWDNTSLEEALMYSVTIYRQKTVKY